MSPAAAATGWWPARYLLRHSIWVAVFRAFVEKHDRDAVVDGISVTVARIHEPFVAIGIDNVIERTFVPRIDKDLQQVRQYALPCVPTRFHGRVARACVVRLLLLATDDEK